MVLITTAIKETFPKYKNEKILFLGEWCKNYNDNYWKNYHYETLDYHWNDRKFLLKSSDYTNHIYEKYLSILSLDLNKIHNVNHDIRYWRIVIGPWLIRFIQMLYDKFISIENAFSKNKIDRTYVLDIKAYEAVPFDMLDFNYMNTSDTWNHFIYSLLIVNKNCDIVKLNSTKKIKHIKPVKHSLKQTLKQISMNLNRLNKIVFYESYIERKACLKLQLLLGQVPVLDYFTELTIPSTYDRILREKLTLKTTGSNSFENILKSLIKIQIPCSYLESYQEVKKNALKRYSSKAKLVVTAIAPVSFDCFKIWLAERVVNGCRFAYIQHGGYGTGLFDPQELHEIKIADKFYSWGWGEGKSTSIKPMPAIKLLKKISYNAGGNILVPLMGARRYPSSLFAAALSSQVLDNMKDQMDFLSLLSDASRMCIKLRVFHNDYGWHIAKRLYDYGFGDVLDTNNNLKKSFVGRISECRLCIATYNSTTYLETFSNNFPTLLFWNKNHWEASKDATPYFDQLYHVGILHYDAKSVASKIEEIYKDPMQWWMTESVQEAKDKFCSKFANISSNGINEWHIELGRQLKKTNEV